MLVDAGPLVALIHARDKNHERCAEAATRIQSPLVSVWPAFTEAMYLLNFSWNAQEALWEMVQRGALVLRPLDKEDYPRMRELMKKYNDQPMDLADAALVRLAEREKLREVFTVDRRDFSVYRPAHVKRLTIIPD
jgi:hypothetical protein